MINITWNHILIDNLIDLVKNIQTIKQDVPRILAGAFDTETTGLHPVLDVPFLFQCGYVRDDYVGYVFIVDLERNEDIGKKFITLWHNITPKMPAYLGHHIIFDLHMIANIGLAYEHYENMQDTQYYIRASSDAVQTSEGGEPLALKDWAVRHISKEANSWEKDLKSERTAIAKELNGQLLKATGWKKKDFDAFFGDKTNDYTDLPDEVRDKWIEWRDNLPYPELRRDVTGVVASDDIQYNWLNREKVIEYGYRDIEYTIICYLLCLPTLRARENTKQVELECAQIPVLYKMERVGFDVDKLYLDGCRRRTKQYIRTRRRDLCVLAGEELKCSQNARIKELLEERYGITVAGTGAEILEQELNRLKRVSPDSEAIELIDTVLELRTLEKWYSTYICKFDRQLNRSTKIYTSINQVGTVSGRVSCDFQQFPKAGLQDRDGNELFDPRRMVITTEEYPGIFYLDYSAQELRVQALFTLLIGHPDENMLRAYCPWHCHRKDGSRYDPYTTSMSDAYDGEWYLDENDEQWTPTDLHGVMTKTIFHIDESHPDFHDLRYVGKRTNFAKNYGASYSRIKEMFPEFDEETCHKIDEAYYKSFPGVKAYHNWCFEQANGPYATNLFEVKYYGVNGHKLRNVMVQGTSAYMTKDRLRAVYDYFQQHPEYKSKVVMQIHDEVQLYWHKDDPFEVMFDIQKIMQETGSPVPIVSDMEVTFTNWKEKQEVKTMEEVQELWQKQSTCSTQGS